MNDRELLSDLTRRHERLETSLGILRADLRLLQSRLDARETVAEPPPMPVIEPAPVLPPPVPESIELPPIPAWAKTPEPVAPTSPGPEPVPVVEGPGFELRFGHFLAPVGAVFALITLVLFGNYVHERLYHYLGPIGKVAILALISSALIAAGLAIERRGSKLLVYGRTLAGGGMACLYYTIYGATYVSQLRVITSEFVGGVLLLAWSGAVLTLAERRKSELLSIFAISLAYFSSAITPAGGFTMIADLLLALTAVVFLVRNAWTNLSYLCLIGTYTGFLCQVVHKVGPLDFEWIHGMPFESSAMYLTGAWVIFTAGVFLSRAPEFTSGNRTAFLCLNNGAWVGLLLVASWLADFGHYGGLLCWTGAALLGAYGLALTLRRDATEIAEAYLAQGLAVGTGGVVVAYSGVTRGLIITLEAVFLGAAGAYSRNIILRIGAGLASVIGTGFVIEELAFHLPAHPWTLTFGSALAMLANAWFARFDYWNEPRETSTARFVPAAALHALLALALFAIGYFWHAGDGWIAPDLALTALILCACTYLVPIFELPLLSQILLILAQLVSFVWRLFLEINPYAGEVGHIPPDWSLDVVAVVTMVLVTWWPRQKLVRTGGWLHALMIVYALAMVAFTYDAVHPHVSEQTWMIGAALLSLVFLAYGAWSRLWAFMASGQILLALAVATFLDVPGHWPHFPWQWWAAAVPPAVLYMTGRIFQAYLPRLIFAEAPAAQVLFWIGRAYQSIALGLVVRWVFGVVPADAQTFVFLAISTALVAANLLWKSSYGLRNGLILGLVASVNYLGHPAPDFFTYTDATAFALFLAQPVLLRQLGRKLISQVETWALAVISSGMAWLFVSNSIDAIGSHNLTLGWALFAVALTALGFVAKEHRQRWCGLAILAAAFVRVAVHDFWDFSSLYKMLTFFVLTIVCLGLSYIYYRYADRLKEWL